MLYLNGDNNLAPEVLHALDMLETVGSSDEINILALVDGSSSYDHGYGSSWDGTKLLYITHDRRIGRINSPVLQDLGEADMGRPETLEWFIEKGFQFPAEHYIFCTFAHGRGIIDTKSLAAPGPHKVLALSVDETDGTIMTLQEFRSAVGRALDGKKFDAMIFFSCLTGMVEIGYALKDLTALMVGSEDEIRIVNQPPGRFQIRGIKFEAPLMAIRENPDLSVYEFAKITIDTFIDQYSRDIKLQNSNGQPYTRRYSAALALIQCRNLDQLAVYLDNLAKYVQKKLQPPRTSAMVLYEIHKALSDTQRYSSFLDLEYYDLQDFMLKLAQKTSDARLEALCLEIVDHINTNVVLYEKHTDDRASNGLSIYLSNYRIP